MILHLSYESDRAFLLFYFAVPFRIDLQHWWEIRRQYPLWIDFVKL